ncbi:MAG: glycosyltransferase [Parafilimonas sp.]
MKNELPQLASPKLLILGTLPLPIGGVSIHVERLLDHLNSAGYPYSFFDIKRDSISKAVTLFFKFKWLHLHTSSVYLRFAIALAGKIFRKKIIITIHGNLGRFNTYKNILDNLSIKLCSVPIVINLQSLKKGIQLNKNTVLISAFIPPFQNEFLEEKISEKIFKLRETYEVIFCTNAHNLSYDKKGNEIYQISLLIKIFKELKHRALVIADPSGAYKNYINNIQEKLTGNIYFISKAHNFWEVIKLSDVFLRTTTTDGDSLSVKEALYLQKNVIATNVIDRPEGVILVDNTYDAIASAIQKIIPYPNPVKIDNAANLIIDLYKQKIH